MITGIVLAAGQATRFGEEKMLVHLGGVPMVCRTVRACVDSRLDEILVVTPPSPGVQEALLQLFPVEERLRFVTNPKPERGMLSSLRAGLEVTTPQTTAAMVVLADMPMVPANLIDELVIEHAWHGGILLPVCGGQWRHPRIIPRDLFAEFMSLPDTAKGTEVIERYRADITAVDVSDDNTFLDVDDPADVEIWRRANEHG
jgi:molybdenum cofactor cytidylyltransferase